MEIWQNCDSKGNLLKDPADMTLKEIIVFDCYMCGEQIGKNNFIVYTTDYLGHQLAHEQCVRDSDAWDIVFDDASGESLYKRANRHSAVLKKKSEADRRKHA